MVLDQYFKVSQNSAPPVKVVKVKNLPKILSHSNSSNNNQSFKVTPSSFSYKLTD